MSPALFLSRYIQSATRQLPGYFEIISISDYQLSVDECVPAEKRVRKKHEANCKRSVSAIRNMDLDEFLDSYIPRILLLNPGRAPKLLSIIERLKICDVDFWTKGISINWIRVS